MSAQVWASIASNFSTIRQSRLIRNGVYEMSGVIVRLLLVLILTPLLLQRLGNLNYGLWIFARTILGMGLLLQLGLGQGIVRFGALYREQNDVDGLMNLLGTTTILYAGLGILATALMLLYADSAARLLVNDNAISLDEAAQLIRWIAWGIPAILLTIVGMSLARAFTLHHYAAMIVIFDQTSALVLTLVFANKADILPVVVALVVGKYLTLFLSIVIGLRVFRGYTWHLSFDRRKLSEVLNFSFFVAVGSVGSQLFMMADKLVVSRTLGAEALAVYGIAGSLSVPIPAVLSALSSTFLPRVSMMVAGGRQSALRRTYYRAQFVLAGSVFLLVPLGLFIADKFVPWWVGPEMGTAALPLVKILVVAYALMGIASLSQYVLYGLGKAWVHAIVSIGGSLTSLAAMAWASQYGIVSLTTANFVYAGFVSLEVVYLVIWLERSRALK